MDKNELIKAIEGDPHYVERRELEERLDEHQETRFKQTTPNGDYCCSFPCPRRKDLERQLAALDKEGEKK